MKATPESIVEAVRRNGSDATTLRDAAHEAHHALRCRVSPGKWDRESIHRGVRKLRPGDQAQDEIMARAVELDIEALETLVKLARGDREET